MDKTLEMLQNDEVFELTAHRIHHSPRRSIGIFGDIYPKASSGKGYAAEPLTFIERKMFDQSDPMCVLDKNQAQTLMDTLWSCGIRPAEGEGSAGSMVAVQKHLSDMRKLIASCLGVEF